MRKLITIVLALLIAVSPVLAHAESMNLAALLADKSNQNLGNEDGVYNALYKILVKANGKDFPLNEIMLASTCMSKIATGEDFSPVETIFDESLSAYEKYFILTLTNTTLTDEEADELTEIINGSVKSFPADGKALYVADKDKLIATEGATEDDADAKADTDARKTADTQADDEAEETAEAEEEAAPARGPRARAAAQAAAEETAEAEEEAAPARGPRARAAQATAEEDGEAAASGSGKSGKQAFITELMRQAMEKMGYVYEPETLNEQLTLYTIKDKEGNVILSAREVLTSLPHAILMKHVPEEKKEESAAALARVEAAIPDTIDWVKFAKGEDDASAFDDLDSLDDFLEDSDEEDEDEADEDEDEADKEKEKKVELTEEQLAELTEKWLKLFFAVDAYDAQPDEDTYKVVTEALLDMSEEKPEVTLEEDGGISLKFAESANPEATAAPTSDKKSSGSSSGGTKAPAKELVTLQGTLVNYTGKYIVYVSKGSCTITIIGRGSDNRWTKKVKSFPTSIGKAGQTRSGTFWVSKKERWHSWSGSSYSPYSVKQSGGSYIHGPMYTAKDSNRMVPSSYNAIGTKSSAGCLGTVCAAAGFIYYNCPIGTMVIISDDSKFKASKPKKIPDDQTYDPTEKSIVKNGDPDASIAPNTGASTDSSSGGSSGGSSDSGTTAATATPAPTTVAPTTAPTPTPVPMPTAFDIKQLQAFLIFNGTTVDLTEDIKNGVIGDKTKEAMKAFRDTYVGADGSQLQTPTDETKATVDAILKALCAQPAVTSTINTIQTNLAKISTVEFSDTDKTGEYDQKTMDAIAAFQKADAELTESGVADKATQDKLNRQANPVTNETFKLTVDTKKIELNVGGTSSPLSITTEPSWANATVKIKSADTSIATVNESDKTVKGVKAGETTITVTATAADDASIVKTETITVKVEQVLKKGSKGEEVKKVQGYLIDLGYVVGDSSGLPDGDFGEKTETAVKNFQASVDLSETGEVDVQTMRTLEETSTSVKSALQAHVYLVNTENPSSNEVIRAFQAKVNSDYSDVSGFTALSTSGEADKATIAKLNAYKDIIAEHTTDSNAVKAIQDKLVKIKSKINVTDYTNETEGTEPVKYVYRDKTHAAVKAFQNYYNATYTEKDKLDVTGIVDSATKNALENEPEPVNNEAQPAGDEMIAEPEAAAGEVVEDPTAEPTSEPTAEPTSEPTQAPEEDAKDTPDEVDTESNKDSEDGSAEDAGTEPEQDKAPEDASEPEAQDNGEGGEPSDDEAARKAAEEEAARKAAEEEAARKAAEEEAARKAAEEEAAKKAAEEKAKAEAEAAAKAEAERKAAEEAAAKAAEEAARKAAEEEAARKAAEEAAAKAAEEAAAAQAAAEAAAAQAAAEAAAQEAAAAAVEATSAE